METMAVFQQEEDLLELTNQFLAKYHDFLSYLTRDILELSIC